MRKLKCYISAGIFLLLTCIKLFVPGAASIIHETADEYLNYRPDYTQAVSTLAAWRNSLLHPSSVQVSTSLQQNAKTTIAPYTPRSFGTFARHLQSSATLSEAEHTSKPLSASETSPVPTPEATAEASGSAWDESALPDSVQEAVQTFLDAQSAFSDYSLPANVSYDYVALPFPYVAPVSGLKSSGFGYRLHPIQNKVKFHYGTDLAANTGDNILAFAAGTVSFAGYSDSYGNYVTVEHDGGWRTLYAHCSQLLVSTGDSVSESQCIALVGATGLVTGPHLHFELTHNGVYVNPEYYVNSLA